MASNVDPAEARAIQSALSGADAEEIQERDFSKPRRFSLASLAEVRSGLQPTMVEISERLSETLGRRIPLEVTAIDETTAEGAVGGLDEPFVVLRIDLGEESGWLVWENDAATRAVEISLGATEDPRGTRPLSQLEGTIVERILGELAQGLLGALGLSAKGYAFAQTHAELGHWRGQGHGSTGYRLVLDVGFDGPGGASTIRAYLPTERSDAEGARSRHESLVMPDHIDGVSLDVGARFGASLVELDQLLSLEPGDVIPLDLLVGDPAEITVQGVTFARGTVGTSRGKIAIRIDEFEHERSEEA